MATRCAAELEALPTKIIPSLDTNAAASQSSKVTWSGPGNCSFWDKYQFAELTSRLRKSNLSCAKARAFYRTTRVPKGVILHGNYYKSRSTLDLHVDSSMRKTSSFLLIHNLVIHNIPAEFTAFPPPGALLLLWPASCLIV